MVNKKNLLFIVLSLLCFFSFKVHSTWTPLYYQKYTHPILFYKDYQKNQKYRDILLRQRDKILEDDLTREDTLYSGFNDVYYIDSDTHETEIIVEENNMRWYCFVPNTMTKHDAFFVNTADIYIPIGQTIKKQRKKIHIQFTYFREHFKTWLEDESLYKQNNTDIKMHDVDHQEYSEISSNICLNKNTVCMMRILNGKMILKYISVNYYHILCSGLARNNLIETGVYFKARQKSEYFRATMEENTQHIERLDRELSGRNSMDIQALLNKKNLLENDWKKQYLSLSSFIPEKTKDEEVVPLDIRDVLLIDFLSTLKTVEKRNTIKSSHSSLFENTLDWMKMSSNFKPFLQSMCPIYFSDSFKLYAGNDIDVNNGYQLVLKKSSLRFESEQQITTCKTYFKDHTMCLLSYFDQYNIYLIPKIHDSHEKFQKFLEKVAEYIKKYDIDWLSCSLHEKLKGIHSLENLNLCEHVLCTTKETETQLFLSDNQDQLFSIFDSTNQLDYMQLPSKEKHPSFKKHVIHIQLKNDFKAYCEAFCSVDLAKANTPYCFNNIDMTRGYKTIVMKKSDLLGSYRHIKALQLLFKNHVLCTLSDSENYFIYLMPKVAMNLLIQNEQKNIIEEAGFQCKTMLDAFSD
ncbi:MAG: hypothetical protein HAW62_02685 [Endozoicomonadaceae bacterium]|nr:hypothetical protein [Endozoicomonadaceae bacterium]